MATRTRTARATTSRKTGRRTADTETRPLRQIAGYVGADPEVRDGKDDEEFTTFSVGTNRFYDEDQDESTRWFGVAINKPELQDFVLDNISKGTAVVVEGVASTVEREGKVYHNMTGYRVGLVDWFVSGDSKSTYDDEDDL